MDLGGNEKKRVSFLELLFIGFLIVVVALALSFQDNIAITFSNILREVQVVKSEATALFEKFTRKVKNAFASSSFSNYLHYFFSIFILFMELLLFAYILSVFILPSILTKRIININRNKEKISNECDEFSSTFLYHKNTIVMRI
jgi:hypothetical protein